MQFFFLLRANKLTSNNSIVRESQEGRSVHVESRYWASPTCSLSANQSVRSMANRWLRLEVYPLFAAVGVAVGICGFQLVRNICINPEVRISKENRAAGVLENFAEGEKYAEHFLRKYARNRAPEIMPSINSFFTDSK